MVPLFGHVALLATIYLGGMIRNAASLSIPRVPHTQSRLPKPFTAHSSYSTKSSLRSSTQASPSSLFQSSSASMEGCVCVVTGGSRGIGKGIAVELGKAGATVYVTGTSTASKNNKNEDSGSKFVTNENVGGPGTVEQTAVEITQAGGNGIAVYCDHSDDDQVKQLFQKIEEEQGRLDLLVNNAFRVPSGGTKTLFRKFWEEGSIECWDAIHTVGLRSHFVASALAVPLMQKNNPKAKGQMKRPMIAMISSFGGLCYTFNTAYGVGKCAVDRLAKDMAFELEGDDIAVTSFYPGLVLTERTQISVDNGNWDKEVAIPLENAETPGFTGKGIIAVATDQNEGNKKSGTFQVIAELAEEYGFTDENGKQPPSIRSLKFLLPAYGMDEKTRKATPDFLLNAIPNWKLPFFVMANGAPPKED